MNADGKYTGIRDVLGYCWSICAHFVANRDGQLANQQKQVFIIFFQ